MRISVFRTDAEDRVLPCARWLLEGVCDRDLGVLCLLLGGIAYQRRGRMPSVDGGGAGKAD